MLGQMVNAFFTSHGYEVLCYNERFTEESYAKYLTFLNSQKGSVVINCIGRIKQKTEDPFDLLFTNSLFPLELARSLREDHFLIHPSTDCVFDGLTSSEYSVSAKHTADDVYGWSKSLGERAVLSRPNSLLIRVSIIGPDYKTNRGLLGWFLSLPENTRINGFDNHYWNGITTLEWCKQLLPLVEQVNPEQIVSSSTIQLGTKNIYTKYEMLNLFQKVFATNLVIDRFLTPQTIYRCLQSDKEIIELEEQLVELKTYMEAKKL